MQADDRLLTKRFKQFFIRDHAEAMAALDKEHYQAMMAAESTYEFMVAASPLSRTHSRVKLSSAYHRRQQVVVPAGSSAAGDCDGGAAAAAGSRDGAPSPAAGSGDGGDGGGAPDGQEAELLRRPGYRAAWDDYLDRCNPMKVAHLITTPLLVINSEDDPVCVARNIPTGQAAEELISGGTTALAVTSTGRCVLRCAHAWGAGTPRSA